MNRLKKTTNIFYKCLLEFNLATIKGLGGILLLQMFSKHCCSGRKTAAPGDTASRGQTGAPSCSTASPSEHNAAHVQHTVDPGLPSCHGPHMAASFSHNASRLLPMSLLMFRSPLPPPEKN